MTQNGTPDSVPLDNVVQETSPDIHTLPDPGASIQESAIGPVCVEEEHNTTLSSEDSATMPFAYIGRFLIGTSSPGVPADEPTRIVANTVGESRHYRMQATVAGEQ